MCSNYVPLMYYNYIRVRLACPVWPCRSTDWTLIQVIAYALLVEYLLKKCKVPVVLENIVKRLYSQACTQFKQYICFVCGYFFFFRYSLNR